MPTHERPSVNSRKLAFVETISKMAGENRDLLFADFRGITVADMQTLRDGLRTLNATCMVVKNRLAKRALAEYIPDENTRDTLLHGPTAIIFANSNGLPALQKVVQFNKGRDDAQCDLKGALIETTLYDSSEVVEISKLPSREQLLGMLISTMQAPISKLTRLLHHMIARPIRALTEISKKKPK